MTGEAIKITGDSIIGEVVEQVPGAVAVIEKYFGNGCLECPGVDEETINFGSIMHGVNAQTVVNDLRALSTQA